MKSLLSTIRIAAISCIPLMSLAQRPVDVNYTLEKGVYVFKAYNKAWYPYVLRVNVTTLENGRPDHALPYEGEVKPGTNTIFTIAPIRGDKDCQFKYSVSMRKCCLLSPPRAAYTYRLPIAPGKETQAYISETKNGDSYSAYAIRLRMKPGDTIFAVRKGVVNIVDETIEVFQEDSSFMEYGVIKKDGAFVKPGQVIQPGTPLGLVGGDAYGRGSEARLSVYYNDGDTPVHVPLTFWVRSNEKAMLKHGGTYTCELPPPPPPSPAKAKARAKKKG